MRGPRERRTIADFVGDVIRAYEEKHGKASDAALAKKVGVSAPTFNNWRHGGHSITLANLELLTTKLLGIHFVQFLYFPKEVSQLQEIEVETLNRLENSRPEKPVQKEVKRPGKPGQGY